MQHIRGVNGPIIGKWRVSFLTGLLSGVASGAPVFAARFAPTGPVRALITDLRLKAAIVTPFTAAQEIQFAAYIARSFTASDSGGNAITLTQPAQNLCSTDTQVPSAFTDIRYAAAVALTPGTRTLDGAPILFIEAAQTLAAAAANPITVADQITMYGDQRFGISLQGQTGGVAANAEGIVVNNVTILGAGGTARLVVELEWVEYVTNSAESIG